MSAGPAVVFPGTVIPGLDLVVTAIPSDEAEYGGEYHEGDLIRAAGETWYVFEWNFAHNAFVATPFDDDIAHILERDETGAQVLLDYCLKAWGEPPESRLPDRVTQTYQPRLM